MFASSVSTEESVLFLQLAYMIYHSSHTISLSDFYLNDLKFLQKKKKTSNIKIQKLDLLKLACGGKNKSVTQKESIDWCLTPLSKQLCYFMAVSFYLRRKPKCP